MPVAMHSAASSSNVNLNMNMGSVKSRSRAGSTSLSHLVGDARNAVYIDSEEVRERLDEILMGRGLEEIDDEDEDSHGDEDGSDREGEDEKNPMEGRGRRMLRRIKRRKRPPRRCTLDQLKTCVEEGIHVRLCIGAAVEERIFVGVAIGVKDTFLAFAF